MVAKASDGRGVMSLAYSSAPGWKRLGCGNEGGESVSTRGFVTEVTPMLDDVAALLRRTCWSATQALYVSMLGVSEPEEEARQRAW